MYMCHQIIKDSEMRNVAYFSKETWGQETTKAKARWAYSIKTDCNDIWWEDVE
jgi:hypothetical protein